MSNTPTTRETDASRDPISEAPGTDPAGTGLGDAAAGAAAGAVAGTVVAGPVGTVIGAALGAIAGGLAGTSEPDLIDPAREDAYWRGTFIDRPYVENCSSFDDYGPAYDYGVNAFTRFPGRSFKDVEAELARGWSKARGGSSLAWERAINAARDAWDRVSGFTERALPGDADRDGR